VCSKIEESLGVVEIKNTTSWHKLHEELLFLRYRFEETSVGFRLHQRGKILLQIVGSDHSDPSLFIGTFVDKLGSIRKSRVDFKDDAGNRGIYVSDCFHRFDGAKTLHLCHLGSDLRKIYIHDFV